MGQKKMMGKKVITVEKKLGVNKIWDLKKVMGKKNWTEKKFNKSIKTTPLCSFSFSLPLLAHQYQSADAPRTGSAQGGGASAESKMVDLHATKSSTETWP